MTCPHRRYYQQHSTTILLPPMMLASRHLLWVLFLSRTIAQRFHKYRRCPLLTLIEVGKEIAAAAPAAAATAANDLLPKWHSHPLHVR